MSSEVLKDNLKAYNIISNHKSDCSVKRSFLENELEKINIEISKKISDEESILDKMKNEDMDVFSPFSDNDLNKEKLEKIKSEIIVLKKEKEKIELSIEKMISDEKEYSFIMNILQLYSDSDKCTVLTDDIREKLKSCYSMLPADPNRVKMILEEIINCFT